VMHVNVDTMFLVCKHAIPAMIRTAGGGAGLLDQLGLVLRACLAEFLLQRQPLTGVTAVKHGSYDFG